MFQWLERFRGGAGRGRLEAIFIAPKAGVPMRPVESVQVQAGRGLAGDRYALERGYWKVTEACQVTLISESDLQRARRRGGAAGLVQGGHRRNLVISGLSVGELKGRDICIGEAILRYQKPRPPCGYLDQVAGRGSAKALGRNSGICLQVVQSGLIRVGDELQIIT